MKYADLGLNDRVRLRKPHPCGGTDWRVVRLGADIGLKCERCGRRVLLPRSEAERRIKQMLSRGTDEGAAGASSDVGAAGSVTRSAGGRRHGQG
ncbi:MAG TPA: DUF951 domain-containing protein [Ktedonobacterales bacterium]